MRLKCELALWVGRQAKPLEADVNEPEEEPPVRASLRSRM